MCSLLSPACFRRRCARNLRNLCRRQRLILGLDLAGGSHILLEADTSQLAETRLEALEDSVRTAMRRADPQIAIADVSRADGQLSFTVSDVSKVDAAREALIAA